MAAYIVARIDVTNPELMKNYLAATPPVLRKYSGKFIARGVPDVTLEGPAESRRLVIIEFPDLATATGFFNSPEYTAARKLREGAAIAEFVAINGAENS